ncbi:MAG: tetraacyldisaccharide 4'-kinase [Flavobacteriaceae bacterium]|nr:tetraacyldisaccharide 4'-kinase [Flavobacteriaceae bacterium]
MKLRKLLFPFSVLYDGVTSLRNLAYSKGWKESRSYPIPVICVGNLSVGGTGKSPMVEYLIDLLRKDYCVAVLSRGYKRKSNGFLEVQVKNTAEEVGDEPLQFKQKFPEVTIAVCADRREGIERLMPKAEVILLDDAFQHRRVNPSFSILLTPFDDLYMDDLLLPAGNLRESSRGANRANIVLVTKCPEGVAYSKLQKVQYDMELDFPQKIFFSKIGYGTMIHGATESLPLDYLLDKSFTLVTGIANPKPLVEFLGGKKMNFIHDKFPDHHHFSDSEISILQEKEIILTTEKDYMRLHTKLEKFALYYISIKTIILNDQDEVFKDLVREAILKFKNP